MTVQYYDEKRGHYVSIFADKVFLTENLAHITMINGSIINIKRIHLLEVRAC